jgi:trans-aconitate methyltransferase
LSATLDYARVVESAAQPYRAAGRFAYRFARGKLGADPVFRHLLENSLIPAGARVLDLGCGQGLLAALLAAARAPHAPDYRGIELMPRDVERARLALGTDCGVELGDVRDAALGTADVAVILDVLHYLSRADQDGLLARVRALLAPGGVLLARVGDASAGLPFQVTRAVDRAVTLARGHGLARFHCRSVAQWGASLEALGFAVRAAPMSRGTPFANVLLVARLADRA